MYSDRENTDHEKELEKNIAVDSCHMFWEVRAGILSKYILFKLILVRKSILLFINQLSPCQSVVQMTGFSSKHHKF